MATATNGTAPPAWEAGLCERRIYVEKKRRRPDGEITYRSMPLDLLYVVLVRGKDSIPFCVCYPKGRLTFSDSRERRTGTAGTSGIWGTRPMQRPGRNRSLTPRAWIAEVSRLIGSERASEIVRMLGGKNFSTTL